MSENRANKVLGIVIAAIAIVAVIVVVSVKEPIAQLDKDSPEGAVQQYLGAITDRDFSQAITYLSSDTKCTVEDFDRAYIQDSLRIGLSDLTETETTATVMVKVEYSNGDPFGGVYGETQTFRLTKADSGWKINGIPWPTYECGGEYK
jgi:hypothetical protein